MNCKLHLLPLLLLVSSLVLAQPAEAPKNWFHLNMAEDGYPGVSSDKLYRDLIKDVQGETVIVAVIDGGVDYDHEDLKDVMWVNKDEVPGNGIDDDKNGYIDDIHGWNFIGGKNGENVHHDNLEVTRLYKKYKDRFEEAEAASLSKKDKALYEKWQEYEQEVTEKREEMGQNATIYGGIYEAVKSLKKAIGKDKVTLEDIQDFQSDDQMLARSATIVASLMAEGNSFDAIVTDLEGAYEYYYNQFNYYYNPEFESRHIVGDNYADKTERYYGNADVKGPDADHGTHVAGIIGAARHNDVGIDGVANNVRIMALRVVPDGDERDKDVANAIIYAVDNGAKVINMSFGKGHSPYKEVVDKAVKYARKKDVLLVHAAGNDGKENDGTNNYPNDIFLKKGLFGPRYADNWIEVGALNWRGGENLAASFSNYSAENVDVFAPGVDIYSTVMGGDQYDSYPGTSMAAPMVSGVAAVLRSYFPDLTAEQVKSIILSSSVKEDLRVIKPGSEDKVPFGKLSISGGILDAFGAVNLAAETKGKNGKENRYFGPYRSVKKGTQEVVVP
jgi:subtilisin family serine protease